MILRSTIFAISLLALPKMAQAQVEVRIGLPSIRFEARPPLVVVRPGVYVVRDHDEEVFFVRGWYWVRHGDVWYRAHDWRGGWVPAEPRYVPTTIVAMPRGQYRQFHGWGPRPYRGDRYDVGREYRRVERAPDRGERPHGGKGHGHGQGHGKGHGKGHGHGH